MTIMNFISANKKCLVIMIACGTVLLIAVAVVVALRKRQPVSKPEAPVSQTPAEVRVKAVERKTGPVAEGELSAASGAVAIVCGKDSATADRYEERNNALRSIARRRDLPKEDVTALRAYLQSTQDMLRSERVAALKNDVMNLLRNQEPSPKGLTEALIAMFRSGKHAPAVLDYCIQHLGAMQGEITDDSLRRRIRETFVLAARQTRQPYAGTALYSLAAKGADSERMSRWSKRNVFPSKIAMGIVFAILGVLVLPKFGGFVVEAFTK